MPSSSSPPTEVIMKKHDKVDAVRAVELKSILGKMRCRVNLKRLNLVRHHHKVFRLKRCDISVSSSFCSEYIRAYNAKHISEILSKLISESMLREKMVEYAKTKQKKTRHNLLFYSAEETRQAETPQEFFLQNFRLKPKYSLPKNESLDTADDSSETSIISSSSTNSNHLKVESFSKSPIMQQSQVTSTASSETHKSMCHDLSKAKERDSISCKQFYSVIKPKRKVDESPEEESLVPVRAKRMRLLDSKQSLGSPKLSLAKSLEVNIQRMSVTCDANHYMSPSKVSHQELIECSDCPRTFVKAGHLRRHRRHVHEVRELVGSEAPTHNFCHPCRLPFSTEASLKKHEYICHKKEKPTDAETTLNNRCSECSKQFQSPASLKRHIRTSHQGHQSECPQCGLRVSRLDNHMATVHHVVTAPCPYCAVLLVPAHLPRHVRSVHLGHRQRCVLCDRFMSNIHKHQRSVHRVTHTDHSDCDCELFLGPCMTITPGEELSP